MNITAIMHHTVLQFRENDEFKITYESMFVIFSPNLEIEREEACINLYCWYNSILLLVFNSYCNNWFQVS